VTVHTRPTTNLDVFEDVIDDMETTGRTALFDAVVTACSMLAKEAAKHDPSSGLPAPLLRVLVLSDGQGNCGATADAALEALNGIGATCDAMVQFFVDP